MKIFKFIFIFIFLDVFTTRNIYGNNLNKKEKDIFKCVVIDAGHGGRDPGATFGKIYEKNITLSVALKLGEMISNKFPHIKVVYTRKSDVAVELSKRSQIANDVKADLFISIHVNAAKNTSARGVETFLMGNSHSSKNMAIAMKENSVITLEDDYEQKYEGFNPNSAESYIIFSLMQYSFFENSRIFASVIQEEYVKKLTTPNRGVKQAGFLVLWKASMPSVLTEIGFLSNPKDRAFLTSSSKQKDIALSLFNAFSRYKDQFDSGVNNISVSPIISNNEPNIEVPKTNSTAKVTAKATTTATATATTKATTTIKEKNIEYRVQCLVSKRKKKINFITFGGYHKKIKYYYHANNYKYYMPSTTYKEAKVIQRKLKKDHFNDAFIIAYQNGKKIDIKKAIAITDGSLKN